MVAQIDSASQTLGFFQVVNHGVPLDLLDKLTEVAHKFFSLTPEKKVTYRGGGGSLSQRLNVKYGTSFVPEKEEALEWKDYVSMGYTNDEDALQYWPHVCKYVYLYMSFIFLLEKISNIWWIYSFYRDDQNTHEIFEILYFRPWFKVNGPFIRIRKHSI